LVSKGVVASEFYKPFGRSANWFVAPRGYASNQPFDLYDRATQLRMIESAVNTLTTIGVTLPEQTETYCPAKINQLAWEFIAHMGKRNPEWMRPDSSFRGAFI
jgi:hypothetical protein